MDKFEKIIKNAVEGYEAPYNPQAWENVSQGLNQPKPWKWIAGSAAAVLIVATSIVAFNYNSTKITTETANNIVVNDNLNETNGALANLDLTDTNDNAENAIIVDNEESAEVDNNADQNTGSDTTTPSDSDENSSENNEGNVNTNQTGNENTSDVAGHEENSNGTTDQHLDDAVKQYNTNFELAKTDICAGGEIKCIAETHYTDVIYLWNFGDGNYAKGEVVSHEYAEAGEYKVTLSLKDKQSNKTVASSANFAEVKELPKVDFIWETTNKVIPTVKFINLTDEGVSFYWNIKGLTSSSENEFEYTFREKGIYDVSMSATGENGCVNTLEKSIEIEEDYNLLAPTAFTPNGDFLNDNFIPEALKIMDQEFIMTIYSEDGSMVYTTRNVNQPWDGSYAKDNSPAPDGGYMWVVKLKNANGQYETYNGQVFITR